MEKDTEVKSPENQKAQGRSFYETTYTLMPVELKWRLLIQPTHASNA